MDNLVEKDLVTTNGEVLELPNAFKAEKKEGIQLLSNPRDWRCMTEKAKGYFQANGVQKGKSIKIRVLNWRKEEGVLFSELYPAPETVVQAVIIDQDDVIGTIVFRTSAMDNFLTLVDNLTIEGKALASQVITAEMEKVKTKAGYEFSVVKFSYEDNTKEGIDEIIAAIQLFGNDALNCFRELPRPE